VDWTVLLSTFGLVFIAELGDKTQLAVVAQVCKYRRPWAVFLGASAALTAITALGAAGGQVLGHVLPRAVLRAVAALAFVFMGALVAREAVRAGGRPSYGQCAWEGGDPPSVRDWRAFGSTLGLLFVAELGDKTQLAVLGLAGRSGAPWEVFVGGALALTVVTALGVLGGEGLCRLVPERLLLGASAVAFVVMGVLMGLGVL